MDRTDPRIILLAAVIGLIAGVAAVVLAALLLGQVIG